MKYIKQKQKSKMKKGLSTILFGSVLLFGALLTSCNENEETGKEPSVNGERTLTFAVSSKFEEVDESARSVETPDTIVRELPNGLVMKAVLEEDRTVGSRAAENVADGVKVLAIVVNAEQSRVHSVQNVTVVGGALTVQVPDDRNVYIVFYSYNSDKLPTALDHLKAGAPIDDDTVIDTGATKEFGLDAMMCKTDEISPKQDDLSMVLFRHVFAKLKAMVTTTSDASLNNEDVAVNGIKFSIRGAAEAAVKLNRSFIPLGEASYEQSTDDVTNITASLSSDAVGFIPSSSSTHTFTLEQVTFTVPIDIPSDKGNITLNSANWALRAGRIYNLKMQIKCTNNTLFAQNATTDCPVLSPTTPMPMTTDSLYSLLNSSQCIFWGTGTTWHSSRSSSFESNYYYFILKHEYRSGNTQAWPTPSFANKYTLHNAKVTPGVLASGKYEKQYALPTGLLENMSGCVSAVIIPGPGGNWSVEGTTHTILAGISYLSPVYPSGSYTNDVDTDIVVYLTQPIAYQTLYSGGNFTASVWRSTLAW